MLETCIPMTFPDFLKYMEWRQSYFTKMSLKAYKQKIGCYTTQRYLMCSKFCALYNFNISM